MSVSNHSISILVDRTTNLSKVQYASTLVEKKCSQNRIWILSDFLLFPVLSGGSDAVTKEMRAEMSEEMIAVTEEMSEAVREE